MPELPEVETVRRGLAPAMEGALIRRAELRRPDLRFPLPPDFAERVEGRRIVSLKRRAKYLIIALEDGQAILAHLGMSGSFRVEEAQPAGAAEEEGQTPGLFYIPRGKDARHDHVVLHLERDGQMAQVVYNDPRRFGFMDLAELTGLDSHPFFRTMGEEPTGNGLSPAYLAARFKGKAQPVKAALLDQRVIAGLGNIYVCEALWRAGIQPALASGQLVRADGRPGAKLVALNTAIHQVIAEAIEAGGSSLRDHIRTDGTLGYFQHRFSVYDREGQHCPRPGCGGTVARMVQGGRSTFFCPVCQR
ncbi:DNA-formamidopyrimidine glycosylase [Xaviernesmea oryzae]|uniref:Formamidopyrimidine-DNA glycosylase n=1 Tax=Xaviernesmea oryzae TaxID=464029 RepID=A0A1Q9B2K8_9HYPH|nr:bifunctional DNA-formamidopyrimidine glycosylase/DNA-(apurinic or apyrimidinic site) lyase [Xaviernesmea oryzae]OLP62261.1 DNA-formamidopyrimidine glycosylase [Xaviernesmea oryzae]SEL93676.1 DNA-(apurinic or apyrimidinic site) lyase [Xaviernesmea oryzae]